jgi:serine/threonine protein phosphatase PrpC
VKTAELLAELHAAGASDVGRVRAGNEDALICDPHRGVFAVIDGMGGHAGGDVAAGIARRELEMRLRRETGAVEDRIREAIAAANASILAEATRVPALRDMACVLTVAVITPSQVVAGHVGDTRLYKITRDSMRKLTCDHSPVGILEDAGSLSEDEAMHHPERNQVFREVGRRERLPADGEFIEVVAEPLAADDAILLCSDGLTDQVPAAHIEAIVRRHADNPAAAVTALVDAANEAGGKDNVTAVLAARPFFGTTRRDTTRPAASAVQAPLPRRRWTRTASYGAIAAVLIATTLFALRDERARQWIGFAGGPAPPPATLRVLRVAPAAATFSSIADAMSEAQPGDTIEVDPGIYAEAVIMREGVALRSREPRAATLRRPPGMNGRWTAISALGVRNGVVSGFVVESAENAPLDVGVLAAGANLEIDDVEIAGARDAAVHISGASTVRIRSSFVHDNPGGGIVVEAPAVPGIQHNVIERNGLASGRPGIELRRGARAAIVANIIRRNGGPAVAGLGASEAARVSHSNAVDVPPASPVSRSER